MGCSSSSFEKSSDSTSNASPTEPPTAPATICDETNTFNSSYKLGNLLNKATNSEVRECFSTKDNTRFVVKVIDKKGLSSVLQKAVYSELKNFNPKYNPNFVSLYDEDEYYYLVHEFMIDGVYPSATIQKRLGREEMKRAFRISKFARKSFLTHIDVEGVILFLRTPNAQIAFRNFIKEETGESSSEFSAEVAIHFVIQIF